jgi:DNA-binding winged helix-turn-helix (wHTH) protein
MAPPASTAYRGHPDLYLYRAALVTKQFAAYRFEEDAGTLWRGAEQVPLTGKAASLLHCLLANAGSWVSKPDIMAAVWPDTHVQPDNIKVLVRELRQALGDGHRHPTFIRSAPGRGYSFIAEVSDVGAPEAGGRSEARAPIFVNRGPELAALADALDAVRASARRLVLLAGEHGAGKTALCDAFVRTAQAGGAVRACHGQCFDRELPHEPYYPFLDALIALDRRHPGAVPEVLAEHAPSWLAQFPQWSVAGTPAVHAVRMFDELCAALAALSHDVPLVLVLEDLQWADADTVNALARLAESQVPSKLLIVGTCCAGEWTAGARSQHRLTAAADRAPRSITLPLGSLTLEHVARYLDARFGPDCLSELAPAVHYATAGNPFMMVNAIDSLVSRGLVAKDARGWRRRASLDTIVVSLPDTLGEAIGRQVDHLDPAERETLEAAAAVGLEFTTATVAAALGQSVEYVRRQLAPLARRGQLIVAAGGVGGLGAPGTAGGRGNPRGPQASYRFRHPLYADIIAQQAPMLRQLKVVERVSRARELANRELARKRA